MKRTLLFFIFLTAAAAAFSAPEKNGIQYREYQTLRFDESGSMLGYAVHEYDEAGLKIESRGYDDEGKYQYITLFEYNRNGQLVKESHYDKSESILFSYTTHTYDKEGIRISSSDFNSDDRKVLWIDYSGARNAGDVPSTELGYAADGRQVFRVENEVDSEMRKSESAVYEVKEAGESPGSRAVYTYNENGNLIKTEIFTPENSLIWYMEHKWEKAE